jgi:uncharacterized protein YfaT (DUF1175 family)
MNSEQFDDLEFRLKMLGFVVSGGKYGRYFAFHNGVAINDTESDRETWLFKLMEWIDSEHKPFLDHIASQLMSPVFYEGWRDGACNDPRWTM